MPRRRKRPSLAKFARRFWILAVVLLVLIAWGGSRIVALPAFRVASVSVYGLAPGSRVARRDVLAHAAIDPQSNVWLLNRGAIAKRIEAIPYVDSVRVSVVPPTAVTLDVRERTIDGCVHDRSSHVVTVDAERRVLDVGCDDGTAPAYDVRAPIEARPGAYLQTPELIALQSDRKMLAAAGDAYRSYGHDRFGQLEATLRTGVVVEFGDDDDLDRKQSLVAPILAQVVAEGRPVVAVDVRAPATPVVEYQPQFAPAKNRHPHTVDKL